MTDRGPKDPQDPDELPENVRRRLDETLPMLIAEATEDVEGLAWSLGEDEEGPVIHTAERDPSWKAKTNVVLIVLEALYQRALAEAAGAVPFDGMTAARAVELLNSGGFGMRTMTPSPEYEDDPSGFVPTFQLFVESALDEFASLAEPTWNEVGRIHDALLITPSGEEEYETRLRAIVEDRIAHYPNPEEIAGWIEAHPGVNVRPIEGLEGGFSLFLRDEANDIDFVFGEFHRDELAR